MISAYSSSLNADQLRAVEHPGGPLLVLAGPGTGKTGVLVARISHFVAEKTAARTPTAPSATTTCT